MNQLYKTIIADRKKIGRSVVVHGTTSEIAAGSWITVTISHDGAYTPANIYSLREAWLNLQFFSISPVFTSLPPLLYITAQDATEFSLGSSGTASNIIGILQMKSFTQNPQVINGKFDDIAQYIVSYQLMDSFRPRFHMQATSNQIKFRIEKFATTTTTSQYTGISGVGISYYVDSFTLMFQCY